MYLYIPKKSSTFVAETEGFRVLGVKGRSQSELMDGAEHLRDKGSNSPTGVQYPIAQRASITH